MSNPTTTTYPEPSVQECLAEDGTPTERLLRLTELTLLLTPAREAYGDPIPRRRAQRAADYADAWADDITLVEVTPVAPWVHRSVSYPTIINTIGHVACAVDHLGDGRTSSPQLCYVLRALAANVRTFAGLESPPVSDSDPQRDHPHTPPTSQETVMTTTLKTTTDPLGDWFRHIGTKLSDTDYEAGIRAIAWARDQFQPEHMNPERPDRTNADTSRISAVPSDADVTNTVVALHAQVHATLALAEQQRIANLIALGQFRVGPDELPPFRHLVMRLANAYDVEPTTDIAATLGIGDDDE